MNIIQWITKRKTTFSIGAFKETLGQTLWWGTIPSAAMVAGTFYYTTLRHLLLWYTIEMFVATFVVGLVLVFIWEHRVGVKSLWAFRGKRLGLSTVVVNKVINKDIKKMVVGCASGGIDPLHPGHIDYIEDAFNYVDYLIFILTRDDQLIEKDRMAGNKKQREPIPYEVRKRTIEWGLKDRGKVVMNIDKDITSCMSLRRYRPDKFLKGGDSWDLENLPEKPVCDELRIEIVFGVGGYDKPYSSSELGVGKK